MPPKSKALVIFGTGTVASLAHTYFDQDSEYAVTAFCLDDQFISEPEYLGLPVIPFSRLGREYPPDSHELFVALGYQELNHRRAAKYDEAKALGYRLASHVSPYAIVRNQGAIGDNCLIMENAVIQPFVRIGNNVIIWCGSTVAHESRIGDHCFLASGSVVAGKACIGESCFIGLGAHIRDGVTVGNRCLIGAGALIMEDAADESVFSAVPGRKSRHSSATALRFISI